MNVAPRPGVLSTSMWPPLCHEHGDVVPNHLAGGVPKHQLGRRVVCDDGAPAINRGDPIGRRIQDCSQLLVFSRSIRFDTRAVDNFSGQLFVDLFELVRPDSFLLRTFDDGPDHFRHRVHTRLREIDNPRRTGLVRLRPCPKKVHVHMVGGGKLFVCAWVEGGIAIPDAE